MLCEVNFLPYKLVLARFHYSPFAEQNTIALSSTPPGASQGATSVEPVLNSTADYAYFPYGACQRTHAGLIPDFNHFESTCKPNAHLHRRNPTVDQMDRSTSANEEGSCVIMFVSWIGRSFAY